MKQKKKIEYRKGALGMRIKGIVELDPAEGNAVGNFEQSNLISMTSQLMMMVMNLKTKATKKLEEDDLTQEMEKSPQTNPSKIGVRKLQVD